MRLNLTVFVSNEILKMKVVVAIIEKEILLDMEKINGKYTVKNVPHIYEPHLTIEGETYYRQGSVYYKLAGLVELMERENIEVLDFNDVDVYLKDV